MADNTTSGPYTSPGAASPAREGVPEPTGLNTPQNIRRLKFVVAGLGAVMVLGLVAVAVIIIQRAGNMDARIASLPAGYFGVSHVGIAPGEAVRSVTMADGRLAIHVGSDHAEAILLVNGKTGEELGRILLTPMSGFAAR